MIERVTGIRKMSRLIVAPALLAPMLGAASNAGAGEQPFGSCLKEFWQRQPPELQAPEPLYALCASHFATLHLGHTETPLFSAEHLTAQQIDNAIHMPRHNDSHEDDRLPATGASTPGEYRASGFDRGHMAPSGDEPDGRCQYESFALSNMIPQDPNDNRYLWADIETTVREFVLAGGDEIYVVTGPLFIPNGAEALRGQVEVPTFIYRAVYVPSAGFAGVYVARNAPGWKFWKLSLADFRRRFAIGPFPRLRPDIEADGDKLPDPVTVRHSGG